MRPRLGAFYYEEHTHDGGRSGTYKTMREAEQCKEACGRISYIKVRHCGACLLFRCSWAASALRLITDWDRIFTMPDAINFAPDVRPLVTAAAA